MKFSTKLMSITLLLSMTASFIKAMDHPLSETTIITTKLNDLKQEAAILQKQLTEKDQYKEQKAAMLAIVKPAIKTNSTQRKFRKNACRQLDTSLDTKTKHMLDQEVYLTILLKAKFEDGNTLDHITLDQFKKKSWFGW